VRGVGRDLLQPRNQRRRQPAEALEIEASRLERGEQRGRDPVWLREHVADLVGGQRGHVSARWGAGRELRTQRIDEHFERGPLRLRGTRGGDDLGEQADERALG
jgi:hypothetical protein